MTLPTAAATARAPTPQQQRAVQPGRLVVAVDGPIDNDRLRAAATAAGIELTVDPRGERITVTVSTSPGAVDAVGLVRTWAAIAEGYDAGAAGTPAGIGAAALADYFNGLFSEPDAPAATRFWAAADAGAATTPAVLDALGTSAAAPVDERRRHRIDGIGLDGDAGEALLLAAWCAVLRRVAPDEAGFLGVYRPGPADELPDAVGSLGRYVPVAVTGDDDAPLRVTAAKTADELAAMEPLVDFFRWPEGDLDPGFRVGFRHLALDALAPLGAAGADVVALDAPLEPLALELQVTSIGGAIDVAIEHGVRIDDRVVEQLAVWLVEIVQRPDEAPAASTTSSPAWRLLGERRLVEPTDVLTAVERHAVSTPHALAVAVVPDGAAWSYAELVATARSAAARLVADGVGPGDAVAVCMERSPLLVAALLAATHVGAAFVPLDPSHPPGRLGDVVADAAPRLVVVDAASCAALAGVGAPVLCVGDALQAECPPRAPLDGRAPAYVIYTSGSTGTPKGVAVGHAALANYLAWACAEYRVADGTGSLVHSSIAVDLTVTSLLAPLVAGRTVFTLATDDPEALAEVLRSTTGLSFLKATPSGLALLGRLLTPLELRRTARHFVLGGEPLTAAALAALGEPNTLTMVTNEYGPTETTVGCCAATFRMGDAIDDPVPIGVPIWNTGVAVVDAAGRPCPPGLVGELVVSGAGVADGYLHRPDLTTASFPDLDAGRSYRTGDRARVRADGQLEYLGRADGQTKIHGYRVEPAEVAAVLARAPGVADAAVVAVAPEHGGGAFLSAFVVVTDNDTDVRAWAEDYLAAHARPDRVEVLDRLPLTPAGKVDRAALVARSHQPVPVTARSEVRDGPVAVLRQVWQALLPGSAPDEDDSFFAAGGDSIGALHLVAGARRLGLDLTVRDVLTQRTLGRIANAARALEPDSARNRGPRPPLAGPVPLSPNQRSCLRSGMATPASWILSWRFSAPARVDVERLGAALHAARARHPALRSRLRVEAGRWTATIDADPGGPPPRVVDLDGVEPALAAAAAGLDLTAGPLVELVVVDVGAHQPQELVWVASHLVADVVSLQVLTASLWDAYDGRAPVTGDDGYIAWLHAVAHEAASTAPRFADIVERRVTGDRRATEALTAAGARARRGALAAIVAAVLAGLGDVVDGPPPPVCIELHGRDRADVDVDLSGAVGWFTGFAVVERADDVGRAVPGRRPSAPGAVAVNYLGDLGAGCGAGGRQHFAGPVGEVAIAMFGLEVVCWVEDGSLELSYRADRARFDDAFVERLAAAVTSRLAKTQGAAVIDDDQPDAAIASILEEFA